MVRQEDVERLLDRFHALMQSQGGGKTGIMSTELEQLVREFSPEVVALAVRGFLELGRGEKARGYYQRAFALAAMHQIVHDDAGLWELVADTAQANGMQDVIPAVRPMSPAASQPEGIHFAIDPQMLAKADAYPIVRVMSFERADAAQRQRLVSLRGRCVLTFDLPDDGKYIWESADVRRFTKNLHEALPYFPYFLVPSAEAKLLLLYYGCLADPAAVRPDGSIMISHESIVTRVVETMASLFTVCEKSGEDPVEVIQSTFTSWPPETVQFMLHELEQALDE